MSQDVIRWKILADGTISLTTEKIGEENHLSADQLLDALADLCGGERTVTQRTDVPHAVQHEHQHHHKHQQHGH